MSYYATDVLSHPLARTFVAHVPTAEESRRSMSGSRRQETLGLCRLSMISGRQLHRGDSVTQCLCPTSKKGGLPPLDGHTRLPRTS